MTASATSDDRRRSSGGSSIKSALTAVGRRFSLQKRDSVSSDRRRSSASDTVSSPRIGTVVEQEGGDEQPSPDQPRTSLPAVPPSPSTNSEVSSWAQPVQKLNSQSPASELPQTWAEWNAAYAKGLIDFNDPPPPPQTLGDSRGSFVASGLYKAPTPLNEKERQRAIDAIAVLNKQDTRTRRPLGQAPHHKPNQNGSTTSSSDAQSSTSSSSSSSGSSISTAASSVKSANGADKENQLPGNPEDMLNHPALAKLAQQAREHFGTKGSTVSIMDDDLQRFFVDTAFGDAICSHTQLKASATGEKDPLVVLDISKDWRFKDNSFGEYTGGFYAAAPIMLPAPMGDDVGSYPGGIFCVIDEKPRTKFSDEDRKFLEDLASSASAEIIKWNKEQEDKKRTSLKRKREEFRRNKLVKNASQKSSLEMIEEQSTPPQTPQLVDLSHGFKQLGDSLDDNEVLGSGASSPAVVDDERRDSAPDSVSEAGSQELGVTEVTPTFPRRRKGRGGVHATPQRLPSEIKSVLDLSTQLVGESLDLDFCYVIAVDLPLSGGSARTMSERPIRLLSGHNIPMPAPLFDIDLHLEALTSQHNAILYNNPSFQGEDGEFSTGLLVKVATLDSTGYILGCFSENGRRVLSDTDYGFCRSFARDIASWVRKLQT
ncbi:hypothetical protein OIO90_000916 [Microbotryomycetes sp. JL221]|nr:hypothetical protein OIO90_000916 [Microbotryomycetes sp. JL221]